MNTLIKPSVDEAPGDMLDPEQVPPRGVTVRIKAYDDMAAKDRVYLFVGENYRDELPIGSPAVGKDVLFEVPANALVAGADDIVSIRYEVDFVGGARVPSETMSLLMQSGFEVAATLDLSAQNYVVAVEKPPVYLPQGARMTRLAQWGIGPYRYASSDPGIARVDAQSGEVNALRNGQCTISATDSQGKSIGYPLTIKGITEVHFLSHRADWQGMQTTCEAAGLKAISLTQIKRFWSLYFQDAGPVADYLGWLNYAVWTSKSLGAGTAWTYDLNGSDVNDNASAQDTQTFLQVLGVTAP